MPTAPLTLAPPTRVGTRCQARADEDITEQYKFKEPGVLACFNSRKKGIPIDFLRQWKTDPETGGARSDVRAVREIDYLVCLDSDLHEIPAETRGRWQEHLNGIKDKVLSRAKTFFGTTANNDWEGLAFDLDMLVCLSSGIKHIPSRLWGKLPKGKEGMEDYFHSEVYDPRRTDRMDLDLGSLARTPDLLVCLDSGIKDIPDHLRRTWKNQLQLQKD
ncbi:uncharacterized protein LOC136711058 [Amia ocellicauda]|uniref:uncharacterized protein LOC136711058 n=1 Tax=Amia ocellicauda TaxID=2972642 RepID=UPI0034638A37